MPAVKLATRRQRLRSYSPCQSPAACFIQQAVANLEIGLVLIDAGGALVWLNRAAERVLGVPARRCVGRLMKDLLREPQLIDFWQTAACRSESCHGHVSVRWPEHLELKLNATRCVLADGREIGRALLFCDVTSDRSVRMELTEEVAHRLLDLAGSTAGPPAAVAQLTPQELRVLKLVGQGLGNRAIAEALCVAESTVRSHVKGFYRKLGIHTRAAAVRFAASEHLS